jgi:putative DNA primase/helicase
LRYNELTEFEEYHAGDDDPLALLVNTRREYLEIDDDLIFHIRRWLDSAIQWTRPPGREMVYDAVSAVCRKASYHPVRDYLAPLAAEWDGTPRLDTWLIDYCGVEDSPYSRAIGAKTLIGGCARAINPGSKVDTMLVLHGRQGARKSTLIRILGRGWSSDTPIGIGEKDAYEAIRGAWIVEMAELAGMGGKDVEKLKAFFSSQVDIYRPPYGRRVVRRPRSCIFIGSTNSIDFLRDYSGSRRFPTVSVGEIDTAGFEVVVDQLWAEACLRYMRGEQWWLSPELSEVAELEAEKFIALDPWEEIIGRALLTADGQIHTDTIYDLLEIPPKDRHAGTARRITAIMTGVRIGWERPVDAFAIKGKRGRGFRRPVGDFQ